MNENKTKNEFKIKINDKNWKKNPTRPQQLRPFTHGNWRCLNFNFIHSYKLIFIAYKAISKKK